MLQIYGSPLSSPTNKVRYVANYLKIPFEFHTINLGAGEQRSAEFLKINPLGRVPAIEDDGFKLAESNAIVRYLADKQSSSIYPKDLKKRAMVDQWIDFASQHVMTALGRIMFNTYFYKFAGTEKDERSMSDGRKFIQQYLPLIEYQLSQTPFIADNNMTLADLVLLAALDTAETSQVDLSSYGHLTTWRKKLMAEPFYKAIHEENFYMSFKKFLEKTAAKTA